MEKLKDRFNIEMIISLLIVMGTIVGSTVPLYLHSSHQVEILRESMERQMLSTEKHLIAIENEMKDFHGRLCAIEERNRK